MTRHKLARLVLLLFAAACSDVPVAPPNENPDFARLREMGFSTDGVVDDGDFYVVEGDIEIPKSRLRLASGQRQLARPSITRIPNSQGPSFQFQTHYLPTDVKSHLIRVDLSGISSRPDWVQAARFALGAWTGIVGSSLTFVEGGGPADISFVIDTTTDTDWIGRSGFPSGDGNPYPIVRINSHHLNNHSYEEMQQTTVHELGHTIGLRHSNYLSRPDGSEAAEPWGAIHILDTPGEGQDAGSVMNAIVAPWNGFSAGDERAAIWLFPEHTPVNVTYQNGVPHLAWDPIPGATRYQVYVGYVGTQFFDNPDRDLTYWATVSTGDNKPILPSTTSTSIDNPYHQYTGTTSCYFTNWTGGGGMMESSYEVWTFFSNGYTNSEAYTVSRVPADVCEPN